MLGLGWTEMLVVGVVALIVIGPKELPDLMRKLGRFAATVRRMGSDFQRELNKTTGLDEVKTLRSAITQPLKDTTDAIRREFNTTTSTGAVEPSGALKPADAGAESVVAEIRKQVGLTDAPAASGTPAALAALAVVAPKVAKARRRAPKAKAAPTATVASAELAPVAAPQATPGAARKAATRRPVAKPAAAEAGKPEAKTAAQKAAARKKASDG